MRGEEHIDFQGLAAFINGELSSEEVSRWEAWIRESDENEAIFLEALKLLEPDPELESGTASIPFDSRQAWQKVEGRLDNKNSGKRVWLRLAAAILLTVSVAGYWVYSSYFTDIVYRQSAGVSTYVLPDSSRVVLSGPAILTLDRAFSERHRTLSLEGRAYFDVKRDTSLTFEINTPRGRVQVLGTAFLVEETADSLYVLVDRGKVSVGLRRSSNRIILEKNDEAVIRFSDQVVQVDELENTNKLYWATKKLTYRSEPLSAVLDELGQIFNVDIQYDPLKMSDCRITAVFLDQNLPEILENISLSLPVEYTISGNRVEITTNGCSLP
ncbi:MAG: FecR domain-containing protein [Cyclobacteriaceae bacterium]